MLDQERLGTADEGGLEVRIAIAIVMQVATVGGSQPGQKIVQVLHQGRVVILVDQDRGGGVRNEQVAGAGFDSGFLDRSLNQAGHVLEFHAGVSLDFQRAQNRCRPGCHSWFFRFIGHRFFLLSCWRLPEEAMPWLG